jgi:hypothetical protein
MKVAIDTGYTQASLQEEPEYSGASRIEIVSDEGSLVCRADYDFRTDGDEAEFQRTVASLYSILETAASTSDAIRRSAALPRMRNSDCG